MSTWHDCPRPSALPEPEERLTVPTSGPDYEFLELIRDYAGELQRNPGTPRHTDALDRVLKYVSGLRASLVEATRDAEKWRQHTARKFPIMDGPDVPWSFVERFEKQAIANHSQTLEQLAQRGGLGTAEALHIVRGWRWGSAESRAIFAMSARQQADELQRAASLHTDTPQ